MPYAPAKAELGGGPERGPTAHECGDGEHVVDLERVQKAEHGRCNQRDQFGQRCTFQRVERNMTTPPRDARPRIRLTSLSHGAG
jgi:hypothetical protein